MKTSFHLGNYIVCRIGVVGSQADRFISACAAASAFPQKAYGSCLCVITPHHAHAPTVVLVLRALEYGDWDTLIECDGIVSACSLRSPREVKNSQRQLELASMHFTSLSKAVAAGVVSETSDWFTPPSPRTPPPAPSPAYAASPTQFTNVERPVLPVLSFVCIDSAKLSPQKRFSALTDVADFACDLGHAARVEATMHADVVIGVAEARQMPENYLSELATALRLRKGVAADLAFGRRALGSEDFEYYSVDV